MTGDVGVAHGAGVMILPVPDIRSSVALSLVAVVGAGCSATESGSDDRPRPTAAIDVTDTAPAAREEPTPAEVAAESGTAAALVELAPDKVAHCRRSERLHPICPVLVPRVRAAYLSNLSDQASDELFNLERGVPSAAPPRAAHVTVGAGDVERSDPFEHPTASGAVSMMTDDVLDPGRQEAISFGAATWGGREGLLFLAPPFLHGGQLGDHLVFEWTDHGERYAYSLHTWKPLADTAATLRAMIEALPAS